MAKKPVAKPAAINRPDPRKDAAPINPPTAAELAACGVCNGWPEEKIAAAVAALRKAQG